MAAAEQLAGHVLVRADEVEKQLAEQSLAVQRSEAKAEAETTRVVGRIDALEQSTSSKLGDTKEDVQALRAQVAEMLEHVAKLNAANQIIDALQARVAELERKPKLSGSSSGNSRPATCDEMEARVEALREFRRKGHGCSVARAAGYSCVEARAVGYSLQEATGYSISEARAAGYSLQDIKAAGYSCSKAKEAGYSLKETKAVGYSCSDAKEAGYSLKGGGVAGYPFEHNAWTLPRYNQSIPPSQPVGMTLKFAGYHMS